MTIDLVLCIIISHSLAGLLGYIAGRVTAP